MIEEESEVDNNNDDNDVSTDDDASSIDDEGISDIFTTSKEQESKSSKAFITANKLNYPTTRFLQKFVPSARLLEQIGSEIIYVLPNEDNVKGPGGEYRRNYKRRESRNFGRFSFIGINNFEKLFTELDKSMERLKIRSYGLSDTTLEEIFLKVAGDKSGQQQQQHRANNPVEPDFSPVVANRVRSASESSGLRHFFNNSQRRKSKEQEVGSGEFTMMQNLVWRISHVGALTLIGLLNTRKVIS